MKYLLGVDLGTSGTKTVLFNENGKAIESATVEYLLYQPQNGWSEQDPHDWYNASVKTIKTVIEKSGVDSKDIVGLGIAGQMHGLVMLDENGEVLYNSIIWNDGRTTEECKEITEIVGKKKLIEITANPAIEGFTAGKILWMRKHKPDIYAKCRHILLPKDYVRYKLTDVYATEVSDASGMNLLDVPKRQWSLEILNALEIDPSWMAPVYESYEVVGQITAKIAEVTGLKAGTPVVGGAGDNAAAAIGTGVVEQGKAFVTIGTSGVIFAHSDKVMIDPEARVHTLCAAVPNAWTVMSCTLAAGGSLQWLRNNFFLEEIQAAKGMGVDPYYLMDKQAKRIPIGADKLIYLPYLMGERSPLLDANARGVFFGLSGVHTKYHMLRAVLEGVVYSLEECYLIFKDMGINLDKMLATGGGGTSPLWRQMIADVLDCPVTTIDNQQGPALGVAILAGVGVGLYPSIQEACAKMITENSPQTPIADNTKEYHKYYDIYKGLYATMKNDFAALAKL